MNDASRDNGSLATTHAEESDGRWTLVFARDLRHPPEVVWAALTESDQLAGWAPFTASRDLASLGDATLTMVDGDTREDLAAVVTHVDPPHRLDYTWDEDHLRWELEAMPSGTRLTLRHTVTGREWLAKAAAGWHLCLDVAERRLDGEDAEPIRGQEAKAHGWDELHEAYAYELGVPTTSS